MTVKKALSYIFPSMGGLFVTYLYNVIDGIFVGQGVGANALGAVNIAVPFITLVTAVATIFPMGGATVVAVRKGRGDDKGANDAFLVSVYLTLFVSILLMLCGMIFSSEIVSVSGGEKLTESTKTMASDYLFYYSAFSVPMLMGTGLSVFVRNDSSPALSFVGMLSGL